MVAERDELKNEVEELKAQIAALEAEVTALAESTSFLSAPAAPRIARLASEPTTSSPACLMAACARPPTAAELGAAIVITRCANHSSPDCHDAETIPPCSGHAAQPRGWQPAVP